MHVMNDSTDVDLQLLMALLAREEAKTAEGLFGRRAGFRLSPLHADVFGGGLIEARRAASRLARQAAANSERSPAS